MKKFIAGLITGLFSLCNVSTTNAAIVLNPTSLISKTEATVIWYGSRDRDILNPPSVPFADEHVKSRGGETSYASYNFNHNRFIIDFDQAGTTASDYYGTELMGWIRFGVDIETPYNIDGFFNTDGNRYKVFSVSLYNENGSSLFENEQRSYQTPQQEFELGETEGDLSNTLTGDQSGFLQPNNNYVLSYWVFLYNEHNSQSPDGATGTGNITLNFNPIPSTCDGDFEPDGDVDGSDLAVFSADFGRTNCIGDCEGDFDTDGDVDDSDLAMFAVNFGRTDCP